MQSPSAPPTSTENKNRKMGLFLALGVMAMVGFSFAAVPLYGLLCKATGIGGGTQTAKAAPAIAPLDRVVTIRFNADVAPGLPWEFKPMTTQMQVKIGEIQNVLFHTHNLSKQEITGVAVHNVQPERAGLYFNKTQCFCFDEHVMAPGEQADLPVQFFIDPALAKDHEMKDVNTITLSYTFYPSKSATLAAAKKRQEEEQTRLIELTHTLPN